MMLIKSSSSSRNHHTFSVKKSPKNSTKFWEIFVISPSDTRIEKVFPRKNKTKSLSLDWDNSETRSFVISLARRITCFSDLIFGRFRHWQIKRKSTSWRRTKIRRGTGTFWNPSIGSQTRTTLNSPSTLDFICLRNWKNSTAIRPCYDFCSYHLNYT